MVAVSKQCCPVCWDLITLLRNSRGSSPRLAIRGYHPHIYPLVLPPCISDEIRAEMDSKFLGYLGSELVQLMTDIMAVPSSGATDVSKSTHRRQASNCSTFSQESSTTLCSVSSNSEGEFEDGEDYYPTSNTGRGKSEFTSFLTDVFANWKDAARSLGSRFRE